MIIMGTDVSGHVQANRHAMYISFVLGTNEDINRVHKHLGVSDIHMNRLPHTKRNKIINKLRLDGGIVAVCAYVEKQYAINSIINDPKFDQHQRL